MKIEDSLKLQKEITDKAYELRAIKSHDYATDQDCLSNFKIVAGIMQVFKENGSEIDITTPEGVGLFHIFLKIVRITNLWKRKTVKNESLQDTIVDVVNYIILTHECYIDDMKAE